jgi:pimeloyl-ACP methyl ester carboxylesterase
MKTCSYIIITLFCLTLNAQDSAFTSSDITVNQTIDGTLVKPTAEVNTSLVIIISDYGPTDRNGNQNFQKNNVLKKLAIALAEKNIASFRYDKRTVKQIRRNVVDNNITFDDFVTDAQVVIAFFKAKNMYSKIYVVGHGQGSLVGMLASNKDVDGFISIAGSAKNIGDVIAEQVNATARQYYAETKRVVQSLKAGKTTRDFPPALQAMFNLETQPFMISWMAHEPVNILNKLQIPIAIINGTKDLQVSIADAKLLANANDKATLLIIDNMNHVLFTIEGDNLENSKSYNESFRAINPELIEQIVSFISKN